PATLSLDLVSLVCSLCCFFLFLPGLPPLRPTLFPYTTLFRSQFPARVPARRDQQWRFRPRARPCSSGGSPRLLPLARGTGRAAADRKSTRLNSSHVSISYAVFCLKKKTKTVRS